MWSFPHGRDASSHLLWCRYLYPVRSYWYFFRNSRWPPLPSCIFSLCEFGHSGVLIVWHLCSVPNLVHISVFCCNPRDRRFRLSFDDVTRINFRFLLFVMWASPHGRGASSHIIWCKISLSSPKLLTFFRNSRWRPPSWKFQFKWIWPFRRVDSVVFVFCTKFGSNICYSHRDQRTYASDRHAN